MICIDGTSYRFFGICTHMWFSGVNLPARLCPILLWQHAMSVEDQAGGSHQGQCTTTHIAEGQGLEWFLAWCIYTYCLQPDRGLERGMRLRLT